MSTSLNAFLDRNACNLEEMTPRRIARLLSRMLTRNDISILNAAESISKR